MENSQEQNSNKFIYIYIILVLGITFSVFTVFYVLGIIFQFLSSISIYIFLLIYMFFPALTTIISQKFIKKEKIFRGLGVKFGNFVYYPIAIILCFTLVFLALIIALAFPGVEYDKNLENLQQLTELPEFLLSFPDPARIYIMISIPNVIIYGITINAFFAFGEEIGWRGFLLNSLNENKYSFWKISIIIGIVWGFWHAPIILFFGHNYPNHPIEGVFMMIGFTTLSSPILTYLRLKSGSVIVCSIFHGVLNALGGISIVLKGGNDLINTVAGLSGYISCIILVIIIVILDRFILRNSVIKPKINEIIK